ncbi:TVP38/TMEM64 family protein [Arthrobacter sp. FW306-06-A]|uniref:TVP38/TMEM64 family protein n=1 Tax=Arthrobacter sp. FW306-06-A TaxID=2879621 RepID=UPI001F3169E1|nr:VTT domain-containing protein [Arthrobacter sp. FW306-06-A]UKA73523.1 VTT domain-containing protein [Arthrobacter sp. FW306-06-A]
MTGYRRAWVRLMVLVLFVAAAVVAALLFPVPTVEDVQQYFTGTLWAPAVFIFGYAALTLSPAPKNVLTIGAGMVFGFVGGVGLVVAAALLGASAAFWLGRWLGREAVENYAGARVGKLDEVLGRRGFVAVVGVRLVPVLPFTAINYLAGATSVGWWRYLLGTALGILPGTVSYVTLGAFGLRFGWQVQAALAVLGLLTLAGLVVAVRKRSKGGGTCLTLH